MKHLSIRVIGEVQGVFFRATAKEVAEQLGLTGWVQNNPDGTVSIEAEGPLDRLQTLVSWCWEGPPRAKVLDVQVVDGPMQFYKTFEIERSR